MGSFSYGPKYNYHGMYFHLCIPFWMDGAILNMARNDNQLFTTT